MMGMTTTMKKKIRTKIILRKMETIIEQKVKKNKHNYKNNKNSSDKNNHNLNVFHYNEINLDGEAKINNKIGKIKYFDEDFINLPYEKLRVYFININNNLKLKLRKKEIRKKIFNYRFQLLKEINNEKNN